MNKDKVLYYIGLVSVVLGIASAFAATILEIFKIVNLSNIFFYVASFLGVVSVIVLILRLVNQSRENRFNSDKGPKVTVKIVDVKDLPKSKEQKLYEQYEDLYKKNLITKEDLDKKKEELLGKK